jgi:hypothetical protein
LILGATATDTGALYAAFFAIAAIIMVLEGRVVGIGAVCLCEDRAALDFCFDAGRRYPYAFVLRSVRVVAALSVIACLAIHESGHVLAARLVLISSSHDVRLDLLYRRSQQG